MSDPGQPIPTTPEPPPILPPDPMNPPKPIEEPDPDLLPDEVPNPNPDENIDLPKRTTGRLCEQLSQAWPRPAGPAPPRRDGWNEDD
jgi:hypothetical protein